MIAHRPGGELCPAGIPTKYTNRERGRKIMKKAMTTAALGLSIIASSLAISATASAQVLSTWYNAANTSMNLAVGGGLTCHSRCWLNPGQSIVVWSGNVTPDQYWSSQHPTVDTLEVVQNQYGDGNGNQMCLGVGGASTAENAGLVVWPCGGQADQTWSIEPASEHSPQPYPNNCYVFVNNYTRKAMGVLYGNVTQGARVVQKSLGTRNIANPDMIWCYR
jgi:hypothetical protein